MMICENCVAFLRLCLDASKPEANPVRDCCCDELLYLVTLITVRVPIFPEPHLWSEICNILIESLYFRCPCQDSNVPQIFDTLGSIFLGCGEDPEFLIRGHHTRLLGYANPDDVSGCLSRLVHMAPESDPESAPCEPKYCFWPLPTPVSGLAPSFIGSDSSDTE
jgi:hypothetical protein